jgi:hypothetical protein
MADGRTPWDGRLARVAAAAAPHGWTIAALHTDAVDLERHVASVAATGAAAPAVGTLFCAVVLERAATNGGGGGGVHRMLTLVPKADVPRAALRPPAPLAAAARPQRNRPKVSYRKMHNHDVPDPLRPPRPPQPKRQRGE